MKQQTNYPALYTLITVFFFWGFIAAGNNIFIPFCKEYFQLDQFQSQLIDFAFYTAYYIGALILFIIGNIRTTDLILKWGYKKSIVFGLIFSTIGAGAMILAVQADVYIGMLLGLFIVALGFSLQQTAANPFAISLGDEKSGASRVNFGGGVNSLGTTIGPLVVAYALFGSTTAVSNEQIKNLSLDKVILLYIFVGLLFIVAALLFHFSKKLPEKTEEKTPTEKANKAMLALVFMTICIFGFMIPIFLSYKEIVTDVQALEALENKRLIYLTCVLASIIGTLLTVLFIAPKQKKGWGAMQYPQLVLGMLAIFVYVGVEVGVGSNLGELLKTKAFGNLTNSEIAPYISMYWGSMMIGRWAGAVYAFDLKPLKQKLLIITLPILAFMIVLLTSKATGYDINTLIPYGICVIVQIAVILLTKNHSSKTLFSCSVLGVIAITIGLLTTGNIAIFAFLTAGLACSVMWPAIFNLSIMGLKSYTAQGSAFLIMMILGGGIIPPIQGKLADIIGIHNSYIVSLSCFVYLIIFGFVVKRILQKKTFCNY